jgi:hypothetical protein
LVFALFGLLWLLASGKARKLHRQEGDFSSAKIEVFEFDGMSSLRRKATSKRYRNVMVEQSKRSEVAQRGYNKDWRASSDAKRERKERKEKQIKRSKNREGEVEIVDCEDGGWSFA